MDAAVRFNDTFSNTVETHPVHNIEIASNSLADKKKKSCSVQVLQMVGRLSLSLSPFLRSLNNVLLLEIFIKEIDN